MKGNLEVINSFCKMFSRLDIGESGLYDSEESCLVQPLHHVPKAAKYWRASSVSACFYLLSHVMKIPFWSSFELLIIKRLWYFGQVVRWGNFRKCFDERQMGPWNDSNHAVKWLKWGCEMHHIAVYSASSCDAIELELCTMVFEVVKLHGSF